jgi:hypothetical protein
MLPDCVGSAFICPAELTDYPAAQVYQEMLAGFLATQVAALTGFHHECAGSSGCPDCLN